MITNFEQITAELSYDEKKIVCSLITGLEGHDEHHPIKAPHIIKGMNEKLGIKFSEARLRKMVNYIRRKGLLPVIATSNGYFCSFDKVIIEKEIKSLTERADGIMEAANGLKLFV